MTMTLMDALDKLVGLSLLEEEQMLRGNPMATQNEWIDVKNSLPEPYRLVLANAGAYYLAYIGEIRPTRDTVEKVWCVPNNPNYRPVVTHWWPLPLRPGAEEE